MGPTVKSRNPTSQGDAKSQPSRSSRRRIGLDGEIMYSGYAERGVAAQQSGSHSFRAGYGWTEGGISR